MSFLNSVLTSIGTGDASITPPPAHRKASAAPIPSITNKTPSTQSYSSGLGQKRKAGQDVPHPASKVAKTAKPASQLSLQNRPSPPRPSTKVSFTPKPTTSSTPKPVNSAPTKPPPKGSFADIMAQAKALQQQKPLNVGMIKHQTVTKERMSKAKRERLLKGAKHRELEVGRGKKSITPGAPPSVPNRMKSLSRKTSAEPEYKGTARPSSATSYAGTAGLPSRRGASAGAQKGSQGKHARRRVVDEYLGTDEEDEGDYYGADDYDDYSDASSDMEAGIMDMEDEEQEALRQAKAEDERELRAEMEAKKAKLERKKKLAALSKSKR
ncbi:hypothetical protein D8B26_001104 [Coccidioides posadasii str. Silveira]|uniref:Uncharacterized protein n=2 Tax=Coccidioides posadasii TaxID=199306 RepID=E9CTT4_COCPS|nr:hypothetical protein CPC735_038890 [Coccidioides posadasii C735 delta SOWgp]EER28625.1 hypothetical protein CPC735_038890 [Coccidioides posadasii C735 delta SOWgp]EFW22177.1 conserved hypothetical protein [Coccidioides posadasii str. Silveira]QVM06391.1 hypothetical protein D8B26_001104 [Coccidioides posadasii str. Silveira]|eukprot:XP_003070770.1 hypothetical protein CPC735_038890 [Coccidioides posadasii C735 delta SOWgp]